jgi:hypothetical protein
MLIHRSSFMKDAKKKLDYIDISEEDNNTVVTTINSCYSYTINMEYNFGVGGKVYYFIADADEHGIRVYVNCNSFTGCFQVFSGGRAIVFFTNLTSFLLIPKLWLLSLKHCLRLLPNRSR